MNVDAFLSSPPPAPVVRVRFLPTVAACMDLAFVTLAACWDNAAGGDWAVAAAASLDATTRRGLAVLDVLFGHGFCLRDAALVLWGPDHPAMAAWSGFLSEVDGMPPERWADLAGLGLAMRLHAHGMALPGGDAPSVLAGDPGARRAALTALMDGGDGIADRGLRSEVLELGGDLPALRDRITVALRGFGAGVLPPPGDGAWSRLGAAALRLEAAIATPDPLAAFPLVTGRAVPAEERESLAGAREVLFCCCAHLGAHCSLGRWGDRIVVCFEPAVGSAPALPPTATEAAFSALANRGRLAMLAALGERGEMYAQELVEATGMPQATIATHLAELESAGLVASERRGHRRYYSIVPGAGRRLAADILRLFVR